MSKTKQKKKNYLYIFKKNIIAYLLKINLFN